MVIVQTIKHKKTKEIIGFKDKVDAFTTDTI